MARPAPRPLRRLKPPFLWLEGQGWFRALASGRGGHADDALFPTRSRLRLFEDGVELGPAHAPHDGIFQSGKGRYSHWAGAVWFSTSDGSDPNTNGRVYAYRLAAARPIVLTLGSCHLHQAMDRLERRGRLFRLAPTYDTINSTADARQLIEACLGDLDDPGLVRPVCAMPRASPLEERRRWISEADVVVLELAAPLTFELGGWTLNVALIRNRVVEPALARNERAWHAAARWYEQGLLRRQEETRLVAGAKLLRALGRRPPDWVRAVVTGARGRLTDREEMRSDLLRLREAVGKPIILASTPVIYTERGKPVSFTPNFFARLSDLGAELGMPVLHPHEIVRDLGVGKALQKDRQHLTTAGERAYSRALLGLIRQATGSRSAKVAEPGRDPVDQGQTPADPASSAFGSRSAA
jgi:hypothetical protein